VVHVILQALAQPIAEAGRHFISIPVSHKFDYIARAIVDRGAVLANLEMFLNALPQFHRHGIIDKI
jgi:hypothetical protein